MINAQPIIQCVTTSFKNTIPKRLANTGIKYVTVMARAGPVRVIKRKYSTYAKAVHSKPAIPKALHAFSGGGSDGQVNKAGSAKPRLAPHKLPVVVTKDGTCCK